MKKLIIYNKNSLYYSKNYSIIIRKKNFMTPEEQIEIINKQIEMALNCLKRPNALWEVQIILINMAFVIFSTGIPAFADYLGVENPAGIMSGNISVGKVALAFAISVAMNSIFAPVFMTLHKITDMHILATGGTMRGLFSPIPMGEILQNINWKVQWGFVFKKTIPLFWFPAHTVTFLLPEDMRVIFAALLGVVLGLILAVAARLKD